MFYQFMLLNGLLDPITVTPEAMRIAIRAVLTNPSYRANAEQLREETTAMPDPEYAVALLEQRATES